MTHGEEVPTLNNVIRKIRESDRLKYKRRTSYTFIASIDRVNRRNVKCRATKLISRNEGKIKSYESCTDLRAWSHDEEKRNLYLRDWMKGDMPFCILPVSTIIEYVKAMTRQSSKRVTPRCHPDCKSKVVLDTITSSCHTMKQCLQDGHEFENYFIEEELETSHWPCEKCLDVLKSIKMFWKLIVEKIFHVKLSEATKNTSENVNEFIHADSVRDVAKIWQRDIIQQALFLKTHSPLYVNKCDCKLGDLCLHETEIKSESNDIEIRKYDKPLPTPKCIDAESDKYKPPSSVTWTDSKTSTCCCDNSYKDQRKLYSDKNRVRILDDVRYYDGGYIKKEVRCTSTSIEIEKVNVACDTCASEIFADGVSFNSKLENLEKTFEMQQQEIQDLRKENICLKYELRNVTPCTNYVTTLLRPRKCSKPMMQLNTIDQFASIPKPFESLLDDSRCPSSVIKDVKDIESEMIITMKNCKDQRFRHISFLQVLHKTNEPIIDEINLEKGGYKKEDPINLLKRVQHVLGAVVKRELNIAKQKVGNDNWSDDIKASFHKVTKKKSASANITCSS